MHSTLRTFAATVVGALLAIPTMELLIRPYCSAPRVLDPQFGFVLAPGSTVHWNREGNGTGHWTRFGVRGTELPPEDMPKILVLGDSLVEAVHVNDAECFTARLEARLRGDDWDVAVLNGGVQGNSAPYYAALARDYLDTFHPRWTVIGLSAEDLTRQAWVPRASHFTREPDGSLGVFSLPPEGGGGSVRQGLRQVRARSALAMNGSLQWVGFTGAMASWRPFFAADPPPPPPPPIDPSAFPLEEELALLADRFEGRVTFLLFATYDEQDPATAQPVEAAVLDACARRGWSCVSTRATFGRFAGRSGAYPRGFPNTTPNRGHLNAEGHDAAAEALEAELTRLLPNGLQ